MDEEKQLPQKKETSSETGTVIVAASLLLFSIGAIPFVIKGLFVIIFVGRICHTRSGCKNWSSDTWAMVLDLGSHLVILALLASMILGLIAALGRYADRE